MGKMKARVGVYLLFGAVTGLRAADGIDVGLQEELGIRPHAKQGRKLLCRDEATLKRDYLQQLLQHEVYGSPEALARRSPPLARTVQYYQDAAAQRYAQGKGPNLAPNLFVNLRAKDLFDGAKIFDRGTPEAEVPQPGDVLLNMNFLNPGNVGTFYSKRGMAHARVIVGTEGRGTKRKLVVLDGGWEKFSKLSQVHSQMVWLRPRKKFFDKQDQRNLVKWSHVMEPLPYDNQLVDDLAEYRRRLHNALDDYAKDADGDGRPNREAREAQVSAREDFIRASAGNFAPFGNPDTFIPPSGNYCSEAGSHIFSYLGFRQYGEVPFAMVTAFSPDGNLPRWSVYENALTGFGASEGPVAMMHQLFYKYFSLLDAAWRRQVLLLPEGLEDPAYNFSRAMKQNRNLAMAQLPRGQDLLDAQLLELAENPREAELAQGARELRPLLQELVVSMRTTYQNPDLNLTSAIDKMFFNNFAYGPNHFLENGDYFELKGVYYNSDLTGGYQAKWVANANEGTQNESTTLYQISPSARVNADGCEIAEAMTALKVK